MTKLEQLYTVADNHNIKIYFFNLKEIGCLGLNIEKEEVGHMIFLDRSLLNNQKLHTEILAHELGHFFTTIGNYVNKSSSYNNMLIKNKCENKANRWAYDYLIPEKELIKILKRKITKLEDIAEYFDVRVEFLIKRLEYLALSKQMIDLDNGKYLILTNLPNLYIYEDLGGQHEY